VTGQSKSILSVVETIPGQQLNLDEDEIYNPNFWHPYIPINTPSLQKLDDQRFYFEIDDEIKLDPMGTLTTRYQGSGEMKVDFLGFQEGKGGLWHLEIHTQDPKAYVTGNIRAKNIPTEDGLKIGIFLHRIDFDDALLDGYGRDAVMFAIRLYLRKLIQGFHPE
jgi:hypothetical protein